MAKQIFVNLPVKDLKKSMDFFKQLGFSFNPNFTDDKAACLMLGENLFSMLITEPFFETFTKKPISDATKNTEVLVALSVESRDEVDQLVEKAMAAGGLNDRDTDDYGWMYSRSFADLDGHQWEIFFADESKRKKNS